MSKFLNKDEGIHTSARNKGDGTPITDVSIAQGDFIIPVEVKDISKEFLFTTKTNLKANGVYISSTYDGMSNIDISGIVSASHDGKLIIQESDDQIEWFITHSQEVSASTSETISSVSYNKATTFKESLSSRYVRVVYVNGATAQTKFVLSAYLSK